MSRDDIIRWAREAGFVDYELEDYTESGFDVRYERFFAKAYAAGAAAERQNYEHTLALQQQSYEREIQIEVEAEREACAKVVEADPSYDWHRFACEAAASIRARGNK